MAKWVSVLEFEEVALVCVCGVPVLTWKRIEQQVNPRNLLQRRAVKFTSGPTLCSDCEDLCNLPRKTFSSKRRTQ